jgi:hypothetical protein
MQEVRGIVLVLGVLVLTAASPPKQVIFRAAGISVAYPHGWYATARPLTAVDYPPQRLAIASYPLRQNRPDNDCAPATALAEMPASGALIFVIEYAQPSPFGPVRMRDFPSRPKRFRLGGFARYECFGPSYMLLFREAGRFFQLHAVFGPRAGSVLRATVLRILDSLTAKPV